MKLTKDLADFFAFTRKDRIGIVSLITVLMVLWFTPKLLINTEPRLRPVLDTIWLASLAQLNSIQHKDSFKRYLKNDRPISPSRIISAFDPNTVDAAGWKAMGLRDKTISIILNYLSKGGRFREPSDLARIYGLSKNDYEAIAPYLVIASPVYKDREPSAQPFKPKFSRDIADINLADTTAFIALPGIGSKLAQRIINFRDKLGGFYRVDQVAETFGIADSTYQVIKGLLHIKSEIIVKKDINVIAVDELKSHPYVKFALAKTIVAYRSEHGLFKTMDELKNINAVDDSLLEKLKHYFEVR